MSASCMQKRPVKNVSYRLSSLQMQSENLHEWGDLHGLSGSISMGPWQSIL